MKLKFVLRIHELIAYNYFYLYYTDILTFFFNTFAKKNIIYHSEFIDIIYVC